MLKDLVPWTTIRGEADLPRFGQSVYVLVEANNEDINDYPFVREAMLIQNNIDTFPKYLWKALDTVPEEEPIIPPYFKVVAWRSI